MRCCRCMLAGLLPLIISSGETEGDISSGADAFGVSRRAAEVTPSFLMGAEL
jgi:hypothetical protein